MNSSPTLAHIEHLHQTYCTLTAQKLTLRFDRQRLWFEFLRAGFAAADLIQVIGYLQKQIRRAQRHVGALKLSNLLQLDRFEEDLNISRVRLFAPPPPHRPSTGSTLLSPQEQQAGRQRALQHLRQLQDNLRRHRL